MDSHSVPKTIYWLSGALAAALGAAAYLGYLAKTQESKILSLQEDRHYFSTELASSTLALGEANYVIADLEHRLTTTVEQLEDIERDLRREKDRNEDFADQIKDITNTVGTLDKLSKLDEELLQKYSKVNFLNEHYLPTKLRQIDQGYILTGKKDQYFLADALPFLEDMLEDAEDDDVDLKIISAYRSFDEQTELKGQFTQVYGSGANSFSADQGYSEHQLGTTVDLTDPDTAGTYLSFADTEAYKWLLDNAHKYGFILSYPENNTYYIFEPWHWRFVGTDLARDLHRRDKHFYDLEQRDINEYLISIFDR